jgi:hypothetical protein
MDQHVIWHVGAVFYEGPSGSLPMRQSQRKKANVKSSRHCCFHNNWKNILLAVVDDIYGFVADKNFCYKRCGMTKSEGFGEIKEKYG